VINLFTTYYTEKNLIRADELRTCLIKNLNFKLISKIYVLSEYEQDEFILENDLGLIKVSKRRTFNEFFEAINSVTTKDDINIISNADIYFDESLEIVNELNMDNYCFALTRWDILGNGKARLNEQENSQDTWIFKGKIKRINGDFSIGVPGCDNRLAYEIIKSGYRIGNPSISIKTYHLHTSNIRPNIDNWFSSNVSVKPPYRSVLPDTIDSVNKNGGHPFLTIILSKKRMSEYLYANKIKRWYKYDKYKIKYINEPKMKSFKYYLSNLKLVIIKYYYRIPISKLILICYSPIYYKNYVRR
jgi:hypothetical protein